MGMTLAIFRDFGNIPFLKDRFIEFTGGTLMALPNTFKSFVGVLLDLVVFSDSVSLLKTTLHWVLLVSEKMFLERIVKEV